MRIRVPATTANLGPGFDTLALALKLYLEVDAKPDLSLAAPEFHYSSRYIADEGIPEEENLILRAAQATAALVGETLPPFVAHLTNEIPLGRGLGSSAAALVAGIYIADRFCHLHLSAEQILTQAAALEGHPDNVAAALHGGLTISWGEATGEFGCFRMMPHPDIKVLVIVPEARLPTEVARKVLPGTVSRADAVYNLQHCAALIAGLQSGDRSMIQRGLRDCLHQPYRIPLVPGLGELLTTHDIDGLLGVALSGAGPSVIALAHHNLDRISRELSAVFERNQIPAEALQIDIDTDGTLVMAQ